MGDFVWLPNRDACLDKSHVGEHVACISRGSSQEFVGVMTEPYSLKRANHSQISTVLLTVLKS